MRPDDTSQREGDERRMPLVRHLGELRTRLIRSSVAIAVGTAVGFWFAPTIRRTLVELLPSDRVQILGPSDAFGITFRIGLMVGIVLAMPILRGTMPLATACNPR